MTTLYAVAMWSGLILVAWATWVNPAGARRTCRQPPGEIVTTGPYRFMAHPMYFGTWLMVTAGAGYAAGFTNALAVGVLAEMLFREWAIAEEIVFRIMEARKDG